MFSRRTFLHAGLAGCAWAAVPAHAQLRIEITGAGAKQFPIAIAAFDGDGLLPQSVSDVVRADLERCGLFRMIETGPAPISESARIDFANWKYRGADAIAAGSVRTGDAGYLAQFKLFDTTRGTDMGGLAVTFRPEQYRTAGHRIADWIYEKLIGEPGIFSTRIAYVVERMRRDFQLQMADADGQNPVSLLISDAPIMSPAWSPDGQHIAYVSFETKKPIVYVMHAATRKRHVLSNFKGSNSAPAWAPDGKRLAVVLTRDGVSQIYEIQPDGSGARRLTQSAAIDTEPHYAPDGQQLYFTSDRGGSPQIYRMPAGGGEAQRVTFEGSYNVSPHVSPDGRTLAFISRADGRFRVATMDLATQQMQILTDSDRDESPSFSPNGRLILHATEAGGRGVLAAVSADGRFKQRLSGFSGNVREAAWAPLQK